MHGRSVLPFPLIRFNLDSLRKLATAALVDNVYKAKDVLLLKLVPVSSFFASL